MNTREFLRFHYKDGEKFLVNLSHIRTATPIDDNTDLLLQFDGNYSSHVITVKESFLEVELMLSQEAWTRDDKDRPVPVHEIRRAQHIRAREEKNDETSRRL